MKYDKLPILLTKAIQEQQGEIDSLKLQLNSEGLLNATSTADIATQNGGIAAWVTNALQSLGMALKDGVATLQGVVVDTLTAKHVNTDQICVKDSGNNDICLTGDQLKDLINRVGSSITIQSSVPAPQSQPVPPDGLSNSDASSTVATVGDNATTTQDLSQ